MFGAPEGSSASAWLAKALTAGGTAESASCSWRSLQPPGASVDADFGGRASALARPQEDIISARAGVPAARLNSPGLCKVGPVKSAS